MNYIALDEESHLIKPGLNAPRMVCMSFAMRPPGWAPEEPAIGLVDRGRAVRLFSDWIVDDEITLIGHNVYYDLGLFAALEPDFLPDIFDKFDKGLIHDTMTRQQLIDIANGDLKFYMDEDGDIVRTAYDLAALSYRLNKKFIKKGSDTWRLRYALLDGVPIDNWPDNAKKYAIDDSIVTLEVWEAQEEIIRNAHWTEQLKDGSKGLPNYLEQHRAAWALHLMSCWGLRTDASAVAKLKKALDEEYAGYMEKLRPTAEEIAAGTNLYNITPARTIKVGKRKGEHVPEQVSKNMKAIYARVEQCYAKLGIPVPLTEKGKISTERKTLNASEDPQLKLIADAGATAKLRGTYIPVLEQGIRVPINARLNVLVGNGRTSCSKPNLQNPPRKGGIRECFVPREGYVFVSVDYDTIELRSLSQVCLDILGRSSMADALRRGDDLHVGLAAQLLNISLEIAKKRMEMDDQELLDTRQQAKVANFGFPGGLGVDGFMAYAEGMGLVIDRERAGELKRAFFSTWSEMYAYFDFITRLVDTSDQLVQLRSGRVRGGCNFCEAANTFFSGLTADGTKEALWMVAKECYLDKKSPLFGCRPVIFLHDEIICEIPYADPVKASAAADRLAEVMITAMSKWIVDVPITAKPVMMRRWYKGAKPVRLDGVLVPCRPVKDGEKTKWIADTGEAKTGLASLQAA